MQKPIVMENWSVVLSAASPSFEQLQPGKHLMGIAFDHADLPGRSFIYTSSIVNADKNKRLVETSNSMYQLGEPRMAYVAWQFERERQFAA